MTSTESIINSLSLIVENIISYQKSNKVHDVGATLEQLIFEGEKSFTEVAPAIKGEGRYWYWLGRMYNCCPIYNERAIDALKTATEIDPDLYEVWNELGESYWNVMKTDSAKQCFERALEISVNKLSLRNLSVVTRNQTLKIQTGGKKNFLDAALVLAKRAVDLDLKDGQSWIILGNSHLASFFESPLDKQHMLQAIACYNQAEKNSNSCDNSDVFYNKAVAYKYLENFSDALVYLQKCIEINKTWDLPLKMYNGLVQYLDLIKFNVGHKGRLNSKRFRNLLKDLSDQSSPSCECKPTEIRELNHCSNPNSIIFCKVLWTLEMDSSFPVTMGLVDLNGDEIVASIFNFNTTQRVFKIGDSVRIPNPQYVIVNLFHSQKEYKFRKVRIENPTTIIVNNKVLSGVCFANCNFDTSPV